MERKSRICVVELRTISYDVLSKKLGATPRNLSVSRDFLLDLGIYNLTKDSSNIQTLYMYSVKD